MTDGTMLPREGLFDRTFSVLAEIRHLTNLTKLTDISSIRPASSKRLTERKEDVPAWDCVASHIAYDRNRKLKMIYLSGILSILKATWTVWEWIKFWYVPADSTFCIHLYVHVKDENTHFSIQFVHI